MKTYITLQRGTNHKTFCEDFLVAQPFGQDYFVGAVADGCSSGKDSHFASTLICKLLRKQVLLHKLTNQTDPEQYAINLLKALTYQLREVQETLDISQLEMLATLILLIYHRPAHKVVAVVLGDGVLCLNGQLIDIDHDNRPDYLAYHLDDTDQQLEEYLQSQVFVENNPKDIAIATDGILSFHSLQPHSKAEFSSEFFAEYLLKDTTFQQFDNMLNRKCNLLHSQLKVSPYDDLAAIRLFVGEIPQAQAWHEAILSL